MVERNELSAIRAISERILISVASGQKLAYSVDEAAEATSICKSALYEDIAAGRLEKRKRGSRTIILADELRRYLAAIPVASP